MKLIDQTPESLARYTVAQIDGIIPDGRAAECLPVIEASISTALGRLERCIDAVRMWRPGEFSYLHSTQYCIYLYFLSNTIFRATGERDVPTRLFLLNKALNGIDLFYEIEMPNVFFIGHSVGIVLAKAKYGEHLVLYQNATVGKSGGIAPEIGERVIIHPNCAVIGRSAVANGTVLSQGTSVINRNTQPGMIAYAGSGGALVFKPQPRPLIEEFFRF